MGKNIVLVSPKILRDITLLPKKIPKSYFGFVYRWRNKKNERMYLGSHKGKIDDGYCGSGVFFNKAVKAHTIDSFEREILSFAFYQKELEKLENFYLKKFRVDKDHRYYNIKDSAVGCKQPDHIIRQTAEKLKGRKIAPHVNEILQKFRKLPKSEKWKSLMSKKMRGRKRSEEDKKKQSLTRKKLFKKGKLKMNESHLKKMKKGLYKYYENMPEEHRKRLSIANTGKKLSEATKGKISRAHKGKQRSIEAIEKSAAARRGVPLSKAHRENLSRARKGMKFSASHRKALSIAAKKRAWHTSMIHKGKKLSKNTKVKISLSKKRHSDAYKYKS